MVKASCQISLAALDRGFDRGNESASMYEEASMGEDETSVHLVPNRTFTQHHNGTRQPRAHAQQPRKSTASPLHHTPDLRHPWGRRKFLRPPMTQADPDPAQPPQGVCTHAPTKALARKTSAAESAAAASLWPSPPSWAGTPPC
ncbi:0c8dd6fd-7ea1-490c-982e-7068575a4eb0 [Thermothielavioides terrestris]|uniref:0c8dd6fd-7ea1-490c-982e-7068575a4eb0 n=1 Tax=Thermothielavioides terrestris TaxID=2587410 RepID=A0A3S4AS02_9PEZI|nr:0c8dd6fd-7ea1-490c-982e-7068575a4eb0 [Thermothielavioides terrestris]